MFALMFSEMVMIKEAVERIGVRKRDWEPRMIPVRYVGHHAKQGNVMGLAPDGLKRAEGCTRLPYEQKWRYEGWTELKGFPWSVTLSVRIVPVSVTGLGEQASKLPPREEKEKEPYKLCVRQRHPEKVGYIDGCLGCRNVLTSRPGNLTRSATFCP